MVTDKEHFPTCLCFSFCCPAILQCMGEGHIKVANLSWFYFGCKCFNLKLPFFTFWMPEALCFSPFSFLSSFKGHMIIHLLSDLEQSQMEAQRGISETTTPICTFTWRSIIRKEWKMLWSAWKLGELFPWILKNTIDFAETEEYWLVLTVILNSLTSGTLCSTWLCACTV